MDKMPIQLNNRLTGYLFCPHCKELHQYSAPIRDINQMVFETGYMNNVYVDRGFPNNGYFNIDIRPNVICNVCTNRMISIDAGIAHIVRELNNLEVYTTSATEGRYSMVNRGGTYPAVVVEYSDRVKSIVDKHAEENKNTIHIVGKDRSIYTNADTKLRVLVLVSNVGSQYKGSFSVYNTTKDKIMKAFNKLINSIREDFDSSYKL